jgi:aerobic-type carbon monoxide dehydrogenase small subunit (CoxS/CutS family)
MYTLTINGLKYKVDTDPDTPLLWVLRDNVGLTGTKYSCGIGQCGACTVHINGKAVRSCTLPVSQIGGKSITTIEGISQKKVHPVQEAWLHESVSQCGYCQPGQIMSAIALLSEFPKPTDDQIDRIMSGNLCRCGTYGRIRKAIHHASQLILGKK